MFNLMNEKHFLMIVKMLEYFITEINIYRFFLNQLRGNKCYFPKLQRNIWQN